MSNLFGTGLVVGKFAPLHRGHMLVIEAAASRCRDVVVISYTDPEFPGFPPALRGAWLRDCFPGMRCVVLSADKMPAVRPGAAPLPPIPPNDAADEVHRNFIARVCLDVLEARVGAVFTSESYGDGFAESLEAIFSNAGFPGPVIHVSVDPARSTVPVSASLLRQDLWANWQYLPWPVAKTLVRRVVLLGAESTGKTTLTERLAREWETVSVPEYGRQRWEERQGALAFDDMTDIAAEQVRREELAMPDARRYLFCDTSPLTTLFYSQALFGRAESALMDAAARSYDLTVLCAPDIPFDQDGTRQSLGFRKKQHSWYVAELARRRIDYLLVDGPVDRRVALVGERLGRLT